MNSYSDIGYDISDPAAETFSFIVRVTDLEERLTANGRMSVKSGEETAIRRIRRRRAAMPLRLVFQYIISYYHT